MNFYLQRIGDFRVSIMGSLTKEKSKKWSVDHGERKRRVVKGNRHNFVSRNDD